MIFNIGPKRRENFSGLKFINKSLNQLTNHLVFHPVSGRHMNLQNELENNRDGTNRVGSTILAPTNNANNSQTTIETANLHKSNDDKSAQNHKLEPSTETEKSSAIDSKHVNKTTNDGIVDDIVDSVNMSTIDTSVIRCAAVSQQQSDTEIRVNCDGNDGDDSENSSSSMSPSDTVFKAATKHISKPNLGNLHCTNTGRLNTPPTVVPLSSPPNVPMFVNRFPNTHPTYLPPHIRNLPKTQSLDLADNEMPSTLMSNKQSSFEANRPIYPNVPYSPYGSPFGSPRNRRRGPLRESRRISIEQSGSFLQLNQYKLMDQIGQVRIIHILYYFLYFSL